MHIHILGIGGTLMTGVALLAKALGFTVSGSDGPLYPPMSEVLADAGISVSAGYDPRRLEPAPGRIVIGNALSRGNPEVEQVLNRGLDYTSGPAFLAAQVLRGRRVVAVAGTHGKTTTASLIAWILEVAGYHPGFLIGGLPENFDIPARLGRGEVFVIEADEYDTAFFDKRAKFVHYRPQVLVLTNLEYDHGDIYPDLAAIERQFHHLVRTVPGRGKIIAHGGDAALARVLARGCWTPVEKFGGGSQARLTGQPITPKRFELWLDGEPHTTVTWGLRGNHNMENALAALAATRTLGVPLETSVRALTSFRGVRRRLTLLAAAGGIRIFDDFAHHPSAIARTLEALRTAERRLLVALEFRSNSMRSGIHAERLATALAAADRVFVLRRSDLAWCPKTTLAPLGARLCLAATPDDLARLLLAELHSGDDVVFMSNGDFASLATRIAQGVQSAGAT